MNPVRKKEPKDQSLFLKKSLEEGVFGSQDGYILSG